MWYAGLLVLGPKQLLLKRHSTRPRALVYLKEPLVGYGSPHCWSGSKNIFASGAPQGPCGTWGLGGDLELCGRKFKITQPAGGDWPET